MNNKTKLLALINSSNLADDQKQDWQRVLDNLDDNDAKLINTALEDNSNNLNFLTKNIQAKLKAFADKDQKMLDQITKKEIKYLQNIK